MKFLIAFALIVAVASAGTIKPSLVSEEIHQISEVIAAINSPSTDPATAALLEQMLYETLGLAQPEPIAVGPAIVEEISPIAVGPAIVEEITPIAVGPAIVDDVVGVNPAHAGAEIIDFVHTEEALVPAAVAEEIVAPAPVAAAQSSPLVQIIINVKADSTEGVRPVAVAEPEFIVAPTPVIERPTPEAAAEVSPTPVSVVEEAAIVIPAPVVMPEPVAPVVVVDEAPIVIPAPVVLPEPVAPVVVEPVQVAEPVLPVAVVEPESPAPAGVGEANLPISVQPVVLPEELN